MSLRSATLAAAKISGGFAIARVVSGRGLRVLCYHGFSCGDEHRFRPTLFITPQTFESRLQCLSRMDFEPVGLEVARQRLATGKLSGRELVITIDDGFYSVKTIGWPLLKKYGFAGTLYVTSYYTQHSNPIFRLAIQYMVWRTTREWFDVSSLDVPIEKEHCRIRVRPRVDQDAVWRLIEAGETRLSEGQRVALATHIGEQLDVDYDELKQSRRLSLLSSSELAGLHREGLDIQLHTHRHRLPEDPTSVMAEIADNRRVLEPIVGQRLVHLCYPSGVWSEKHWPALKEAGIETATTCEPGINYPTTPMLRLHRFLDGQDVPALDFEAEVSGFKEVARRFFGRARNAGAPIGAATY